MRESFVYSIFSYTSTFEFTEEIVLMSPVTLSEY